MTYTCLTVSQVSPARGMTMVMSARKELTWSKKQNQSFTRCKQRHEASVTM